MILSLVCLLLALDFYILANSKPVRLPWKLAKSSPIKSMPISLSLWLKPAPTLGPVTCSRFRKCFIYALSTRQTIKIASTRSPL